MLVRGLKITRSGSINFTVYLEFVYRQKRLVKRRVRAVKTKHVLLVSGQTERVAAAIYTPFIQVSFVLYQVGIFSKVIKRIVLVKTFDCLLSGNIILPKVIQ